MPNLDDSMYYIIVKDFEKTQEFYDMLIMYQSVFILFSAGFYFAFL